MSSDIKWFQSLPKYSCGGLNTDHLYKIQYQSPLDQLTFGYQELNLKSSKLFILE
jgi:hypothetical protein